KDTAELEDIVFQMDRPESTQTVRMLWSICSDLLELSRNAPSRLAERAPLKDQAPEVLAERLKLATAEFVRLRDDRNSDREAFDAPGRHMDDIANARITHVANQPSVVALQLEAVAAQASLHARKGEVPELDETIDFADFQRLVETLAAVCEGN